MTEHAHSLLPRLPNVAREERGREDRPCILVVADKVEVRHLVQEALGHHGYAVLAAASGGAAVGLLEAHPVGVVILDGGIPEDGRRVVCMYLRANRPHRQVPMILLSAGEGAPDAVTDLLGVEADAIISGPIRGEELAATVGTYLHAPQVAQETRGENREFRVLHAVTEAVHRSLNRDEILRMALEKVRELEEVGSAYFLLDEREHGGVTIVGDQLATQREPVPTAIEAEVLREAAPRCYPELSQAPSLRPLPVPPEARSALLVPLVDPGRVAGILGVFSRRPARFGDSAVRLFSAIGRQVTLALSNAGTYRSMAKQLGQLQALSPFRSPWIGPPAREEGMWELVKQFLETVQVDRCAITLAASKDVSAHLIVGYDRSKKDPWIEGINLSLDRYPEIRWVLEHQRPLVVPDVAVEPILSDIRDFLLTLPIRSMLVLPLVRRDQSIGVVTLSSRGSIRQFTPEEIELCQKLADQAALAIEKSAVFHEVQDRANKLQSLLHLTKRMTASLNLQVVYDFAVQAAADFLEVPCVCLLVVDEETRQLSVVASFGLRDFPDWLADRLPSGAGLIGRIVEQREPQYLSDVRQDVRWLNKRFLEEAGIASFAGIPLIIDGRVLGILVVFTRHRRLFSPDERALMGSFAGQAAIAIGNARAYQQIQRYASTVAELYEAATQVSGSLDLDETLQKIARGAAASTDAASSTIILLDELGEVTHVVDWGVGEIEVRRRGISRQVWETGRPVVLADFASVPPETINPRLLALGRRAAVCLPLQVRDRVRGVMWVHYDEPRRIAEEDLHLLASFANQAAIAIENARLFAETRRLANTDALTGLYNHRYFYHLLDTEVKRARRYGRALSLIMLDIDHFKQFNDRYGHLAGDEALRCLAQILRKNARRVDTVARYGGEEFAIILPETDLSQAAVQAERLRAAAAEQQWPEGHLTISAGTATLGAEMTRVEDLVRDADRALYQAKAAGRNQVCLASTQSR